MGTNDHSAFSGHVSISGEETAEDFSGKPSVAAGEEVRGSEVADDSGQGNNEPSLLEAIRGALGASDDEGIGAGKAAADAQAVAVDTKQKKTAADPDFATPVGLSKESASRFAKLVDRTKSAEGEATKWRELKPQYEAMKADVDELRNMFAESHCTSERLSALLAFNRMIETGDYAGAKKALMDELRSLSALSGESVDGIDPLAEHDDLMREVEDGMLSRARAEEIVRSRAREANTARRSEAERTAAQRETLGKAAIDGAIKSIEEWVADITKNDIDFIAKRKNFMASVDEIIAQYPPELWLQTLKREYKMASRSGSQDTVADIGETGMRPLRPSGSGEGKTSEPKTMHESIMRGLHSLRGR